MAFTTVTGSNGVTSLVGTTGIDVATIVTLASNVFVGGNTGNDVVTTNLGTGGSNLSNYNVRMGGGDDTFTTVGDTLLNSFISLDGETIANDGNDTFTGGGNLIINSEIVGRGGNDAFTGMALNGSTLNGNTGDDNITLEGSSASFVYGGQGTDIIATTAGAANSSTSVLINGNKGSDTITLAASGFANGSVYGGNGNDTISADAVTDAAGADLGVTAAGVFLSGDLGDDTLTGSDGIDTINGGDGNDSLVGGTGADVIDGGSGNDTIIGGVGADTIAAAGNDILGYGGLVGGALNQSVLTSATSNTGFDTITDFSANTAARTATANGDRFSVAAAVVTAVDAGGIFNAPNITAGANLAATLDTAFDGNLANNGVGLVTITGASSFAGNYVVINGAADTNYDFAADAVIKVNTLANITNVTFATV